MILVVADVGAPSGVDRSPIPRGPSRPGPQPLCRWCPGTASVCDPGRRRWPLSHRAAGTRRCLGCRTPTLRGPGSPVVIPRPLISCFCIATPRSTGRKRLKSFGAAPCARAGLIWSWPCWPVTGWAARCCNTTRPISRRRADDAGLVARHNSRRAVRIGGPWGIACCPLTVSGRVRPAQPTDDHRARVLPEGSRP